MIGLGIAVAIVWRVQTATPPPAEPLHDVIGQLALDAPIPLRTRRALTSAELEQGRIAWRYFENNYVPSTGLVNSVDNYTSTTLWDLGSYMMGLLAARDLGIVEPATAHARLDRLLDSLARLPLVEGLPNKAYNTQSLRMVDYENHDSPLGIGWSAIDIARLSVPLAITMWRDPDLAPKIRKVIASWSLDKLVSGGRMFGAVRRPDGRLELVQEGRLGYEQYAAHAFVLLGLDVERAARWDLTTGIETVSGQPIPYDTRLPATHDGAHNAVLSEPFLLEAFELGLTETSGAFTEAVYRAQRNRANELGKPVSVSEDNIDRAPYFVYNSVLNGGTAWAAFTPAGVDASAFRTLSTKAAFGWGHLYGDEYAGVLLETVAPLHAERGYYSGIYDSDGTINTALTANTNGIVLEVLWYTSRGPLLREARK